MVPSSASLTERAPLMVRPFCSVMVASCPSSMLLAILKSSGEGAAGRAMESGRYSSSAHPESIKVPTASPATFAKTAAPRILLYRSSSVSNWWTTRISVGDMSDYQANLFTSAGDIDGPVTIESGASTKTAAK